MSDISIQFHILVDELTPIVLSFADENQVSVCALKYGPFESIAIAKQALVTVIRQPDVPRIAFTIRPPVFVAKGMMQFLDRNPSALLLDIGRQAEAGLHESGLTARTSDNATLGVWRNLSRQIVASTRTGVIAVNLQSGATSPLRSHRFSNGAKALERAGVPMLPVAGTARLRFSE